MAHFLLFIIFLIKEYLISGNNSDICPSVRACFCQALLQALACIISQLHSTPGVLSRCDSLLAQNGRLKPEVAELLLGRAKIPTRSPWSQKLH